MSLINIPEGSPVNKANLQIVDNNFEELRIKYNLFIPRVNVYLQKLKPPYQKDLLIPIAANTLIKLADKPTLNAEDLNYNFSLFRNNLLLLGVKNLHKDNTIIDIIEDLKYLFPNAPINLHDQGLLDATLGLVWTDTSNCEAGFELYEKLDNYDWVLKELPIANAEFKSTVLAYNLENSANVNIGDPEYTGTYRGVYSYKIRAQNAYAYSDFSNMHVPAFSISQPQVEFQGVSISTATGININLLDSSDNEDITGYEVYTNYFSSPIDVNPLNEQFTLWKKTDVAITNMNYPYIVQQPIFEQDSYKEMKNQYMAVKVLGYNKFQRSIASSIGYCILPPLAPQNLAYTLNTPAQGGDYFVQLTWAKMTGSDSDIEVWQSTNNGTYFLAHTASDLLGGAKGCNVNIGNNPTASLKFKVRAVNDSGISEFSNEITVNNFAAMVAPSNLTYTVDSTNKDDIVVNLSWTNNSSYNQIEVWMSHGGNTSVPLPPMVLFATISGSSTTYAIHIENIPGYYYYDNYTTSFNFSFKVRGVR